MTLNEAEKTYGIVFPKKWHQIHDMGAMEWLEVERGDYSREDFQKLMKKYSSMPNQFAMIYCDIEPISYSDMKDEIEYFNEIVGYKCEDEGVKLKDGIKMFPFARTGGGDFFCFIYTDDIETAKIGLYYHDDYDTPEICADRFDEFLLYMLLEAASWNAEDKDYAENEQFKFHISLLSDEYKAKVEGKTTEELADVYEDIILRTADIWEKV